MIRQLIGKRLLKVLLFVIMAINLKKCISNTLKPKLNYKMNQLVLQEN